MFFLRKITRCWIGLCCLVNFYSGLSAEPIEWEIDPDHFSLAFEVGHIGYQKQLGFFLEATGEFLFDPESLEFFSGNVEVNASSVFTNNEDRDSHLNGRDFLNSKRYPVVSFEAIEFFPNENRNGGELHGSLILLGVAGPVVLAVTINKRAEYPFGHRKETLGVSATTTLDRSQWGMDYGVANNMVGDLVTLRFEFEAIQR